MSNPTRIGRIAHTAASPEGENSTYALPDSGLVVDPGPPGDPSWETLTAGLSTMGLPIDAVETVVITHWHADHAGLAPRLAAAADADLAAHEADAPLVADYTAERERRLDRDARRLREWGAPEAVVTEVVGGDTPSPMPNRCSVTAVDDGDAVAGLEAIHTPGHTAGHLALDAGDALLVGDAVLPTYTPNVGGSDTRVESALSTYLDAIDDLLERFGEGSAAETDAYPGHGSTVDLSARIQMIRRHHAERVRNAVAALPAPDIDSVASDSDDAAHLGRTPWAVAVDLFGEMRGVHAKMGAGEAAAHLAFAADAGFVERVAADPDRYIRRAPGRHPDLPIDGL